MKPSLIAALAAATLALAACESTETRTVIVNPTPATLTAEALAADRNWTVVGALSGAAVGTLVARNAETGACAYVMGDGTYRVANCI
jgi:osmotically inducible lipoprotein OsmB